MDEKRTRIGIGSRFDTRFEVLIVAFLELPHVRTWHGVVVAKLARKKHVQQEMTVRTGRRE